MRRFHIGISGLAILLLALLPAQNARALEKTDDIDTNRPSFMDSPLVVPQASIQSENGTLFQGFRGSAWQYDVPEDEVRIGIDKRTEIQFFTPNYNLLHTDGSTHSYVSDLSEIGIKEQLGPILPNSKSVPGFLRNYNLAAIIGVTPPTNDGIVSMTGTGTGGTLRFPWSKSVGKTWCIAGMQSLLIINSGRNLQYQPDVLIGKNIGARGFIFAEYGGFLTGSHHMSNIAHFGAVRKLTRRQQVDMQFGFGMDNNSPIALVGVGYSLRFDKFKW